MGWGCCRAGTGTLSICVYSVPVSSAPGRRLVAPRPGTPRQGPERPGPGRDLWPGAARIQRLFVIRHAAADTRDIRYGRLWSARACSQWPRMNGDSVARRLILYGAPANMSRLLSRWCPARAGLPIRRHGDFSGTGHFDLPALPCLAIRGLPCRTGALDRLALITQVPRSLQHRRAGSAFSRPAG